jgi:hypothetical protein
MAELYAEVNYHAVSTNRCRQLEPACDSHAVDIAMPAGKTQQPTCAVLAVLCIESKHNHHSEEAATSWRIRS